MIFTKHELKEFLESSCEGYVLSHDKIYDYVLQILDWHDDNDPRDITTDDVDSLTDLIARDLDAVLTTVENVVKKQVYPEES